MNQRKEIIYEFIDLIGEITEQFDFDFKLKDALKKCGQTLQAESSMVRTLFEGRRQTHVDGRPCCVGRDCHLVLHLDGWLI